MPQFLNQLLPIVVMFCSLGVLIALIKFWEWENKTAKKKNPLTSDLLRSPGETLRDKIVDLQFDRFGYVLMLFVMPLAFLAMALSSNTFGRGVFQMTMLILTTTGTISFCIYKMRGLRKLIQQYNLGLDAEMAVGQELNHLMRDGFWVYHDFPADEFNIDHVVIGSTGVFAVETKGRPKPIKDDGITGREVFYDGATLTFPTWKERKPAEQAEYQAKWLEKWLSSAVGEQVSVYPVLAIPGWLITRQKQGGVPVINGKNCSGFFTKYGNGNLSGKLTQQIVHNVDQRCRTVLPRSYREA